MIFKRKALWGHGYCICNPMSKLDKVKHLLKIADELKILNDTMFDKLMDKYEQRKLVFDFMLENIDSCILQKVSVEDVKDNFMLLLEANTYNDIQRADLYVPYKAYDQE